MDGRQAAPSDQYLCWLIACKPDISNNCYFCARDVLEWRRWEDVNCYDKWLESGRHALTSGRNAMTLNNLETAWPLFDDEQACVELTRTSSCWTRHVSDVLNCLIREARPRGPSGTPVTRDVTALSTAWTGHPFFVYAVAHATNFRALPALWVPSN